MSLMGIDVGTTGVKAGVFDVNGALLSLAYEEYSLLFPFAGASELDSGNVMYAALRVVNKAALSVSANDPVRAIGIASQGEAFTPIDANGRVMANAMTSSDGRAESLVDSWTRDFGSERLYEITGHTAYPMYSLFKLLWLKQNQPEIWNGANKFLFFTDLLAFTLTGECATDYTMAARSMLFDVRAKTWSKEILDSLGLDSERLPRVITSGGVVGEVKARIALECGVPPGTTVSVCGHDQPAGALGCGAAAPGKAAYSIGTVECICPAVDHPILTRELMDGNLAMYPHVLPDTYTTVAFNTMGGGVLKWVRDNFATEEASEARRAGEDPYDRIIATASDEPADAILLPHFGPTGTPHFDSFASGALVGLTLSTTRAEILRAFLEGITYEMKWNLSILEDAGFVLNDLRAVGGGAKSDTWMQIKADILGVPLTTMKVAEATCMGAAILAGAGAGFLEPRSTSEMWATPIRTFEPREDLADRYGQRFAIYKETYKSQGAVRRLLHELKGESTKNV